jgi:hypothetical protein
MDSFLLNVVQPALEYDGHDVRAMTHYVESPDDIDDLFDYIAYEKGEQRLAGITERPLNFYHIPSRKCSSNDAKRPRR